MRSFFLSTVALLVVFLSTTTAFAPPSTSISSVQKQSVATVVSSTALNERQWNFNEGRGPWGMKKNAEIWNGRAAQLRNGVVGRYS
eukprot:10233492-Ditylum_brightwellii.AAC.1